MRVRVRIRVSTNPQGYRSASPKADPRRAGEASMGTRTARLPRPCRVSMQVDCDHCQPGCAHTCTGSACSNRTAGRARRSMWVDKRCGLACSGACAGRRGARLVDVRQRRGARPHLGRGRPQQRHDAPDLVQLALAREQHLLCQQLGHDAAERPDVDGRAVLLGACARRR